MSELTGLLLVGGKLRRDESGGGEGEQTAAGEVACPSRGESVADTP